MNTLKAIEMIMNRIDGKPTERTENLNLEVSKYDHLTDQEIQDEIDRLRSKHDI